MELCAFTFCSTYKMHEWRAKLCSGGYENQELINMLDTCLYEELVRPEIFFVAKVHLLHRF